MGVSVDRFSGKECENVSEREWISVWVCVCVCERERWRGMRGTIRGDHEESNYEKP